MECLTGILTKVNEILIDPMLRQVGYVFNYRSNIHDLEEEVEKLKSKKERVQHKVEKAKLNPTQEIESDVQQWLTRVDYVTKEAQEILLGDKDGAEKKCFVGLCPNLKIRHWLSREAVKQSAVAARIKEEGNFEKVSYDIDPPGIGPVSGYQAFESRTLVLDEIMKALKEAEENLVGVYGMSGVGKSMLVKKLAAQVETDGLFKKVVWATVTDKPDLRAIQQEIADGLSYNLEVESVQVRAARLHERLKREGRMLIILDDIWDGFTLENIGIPCGDDDKGGKVLMHNSKCGDGIKPEEGGLPNAKLQDGRCKILITSRNRNTLSKLGVQKENQHFLQLLKDEDAKLLFEKKVVDVKDDIIAAQLVNRCAGLPVLIVIVATALIDKELSEWKDALEQIKQFNNEGIGSEIYSPLEVSFKFLTDEEKKLFLLCGQVRSLNFISINDLLKYSIGLSLFNHCTTVRVTRNRLLKVVNGLKRSCLLLEGDDSKHIKMHDVVHSFAVSVASQKYQILTGSVDNELEEWPEIKKLQRCTAISLVYCKLPVLPERLECPKLKSFIMYNDDPSLRIPMDFFSRMRELKLMDLTQVHLSPFPQSLQFVVNLQTLCLDSCVLEDVAAIRNLKKLRVLSFIGSSMVCLPSEIGDLTSLQILDLSRAERLKVIRPNVLSRLTRLEALYMGNSFVQWEAKEHDDGQRKNASLDELKLLLNVVVLELCITDAKVLPRELFSKDLESFKIFIGKEWDCSDEYNTTRLLKLKLDESIQLDRVKLLLKKAEDLYLDQLQGVNNVLSELDGEGFQSLKHLHIQNNEIRHVVGSVFPSVAFPSLESLDLHNLSNLEKICHGALKAESFGSLRKLNVENCNRLKNLFSYSLVRGLARLQEVNMNSCEVMEEIIAKKSADDFGNDTIEFTRLCTLVLKELPKFTSFSSGLEGPLATQTAQSLKGITSAGSEEILCGDEPEIPLPLFNSKIILPNLEDLKLYSVSVKKIWSSQLAKQPPSIHKLTTLSIHGCEDLKFIFTYSLIESLVQLKRLEICDCKSLKEIVSTQRTREGEPIAKILFPNLDFLKLGQNPELQSFCTSNLIECPRLKTLWIGECELFKTFVSSSESTDAESNSPLFNEKVSFPNLEFLHIVWMHKLKMIWHDEIQEGSFDKLKKLTVMHGRDLLKIFPSKLLGEFQNLESLIIRSCDLLKEVFDLHELTKVQERSSVIAFKLKNLDISNLPKLECVWNQDPQGVMSFDNLTSVSVAKCPILKNIFHASISKCLMQLENLYINESGVEEIVIKDTAEETNKFLLPRLKYLTLWSLADLKCFYSGRHILECPELEKLTSYHCYKLKLFASEPQDLQEAQMERKIESQDQRPLFPFKKVVSNLAELSLSRNDVKMFLQDQFPADLDLFHKVKILHLLCFKDGSGGLPFDFLQKFPNMERLHVGCSKFKELLPYGVIEEKHVRSLTRIQVLELDALPNLRHIWNPHYPADKVLEAFANITTLVVLRCGGLVSLLTLTTSKIMVNLKKIRVKDCNMVTEIVAKEEDGSQSESAIVFDKLESLSLDGLNSLTCFCLANYILEFPSLEELFVMRCPRMKVFSQAVIKAPKLQKVYLTQDRYEQRGVEDEWRSTEDLNKTIQQLHEEMVGFSSLNHLKLSEFPELQELWHDQSFPVRSLQNLTSLVVDGCPFPSCAVPSNLLPFVKYLEELEVSNCHLVEEVFGAELANREGQSGLLSNLNGLQLIDLPRLTRIQNDFLEGILEFKNLKLLKIHNCNNLRNIFTVSMCSGLLQLYELEVKSCAMVKVIIVEGLAEEGALDHIKFPLLNSITIEALPSLTNFYSGNHTVECPSLKKVLIVDCSCLVPELFKEPESDATDGMSALQIALPNLEDLKLYSVSVQRLWSESDQPTNRSLCIQNLTTLIIDGCGDLNYIFTSSMIPSVAQLRRLQICNCNSLEEIITAQESRDGETISNVLFPELDSLMLQDLPKLQRFCTGNSINCPKMEVLQIESCHQLKFFMACPVSDCRSTHEPEEASQALFDEKVSFPILKELHILRMNNLKVIWHTEMQNLESLVVYNCVLLEVVFDLQVMRNSLERNEMETFKLKNLDIQYLPNLKHVWGEDPHEISLFHNLRSVNVHRCPNLKSLFPASIATCLRHLEKLTLYYSGLEEIVAKDKAESAHKFVFPQLKTLFLWQLQELQYFYFETHILECPKLDKLVSSHCRLKLFFSDARKRELARKSNEDEQQLFDFKKVVPNLHELSLTRMDVKMIMEGDFPAELFLKVKCLHLLSFNDDSEAFPFDFLQNLACIEWLHVGSGEFKELLSCGVDEERNSRIFSRLRFLKLDVLQNIRHLYNSSCQTSYIFQTLEELEIMGCKRLVNLAPSYICFGMLINLNVRSCEGLVNLVTLSTATSMGNLEYLSISGCNSVTEIVVKDEDNESLTSPSEIIFYSLQRLSLEGLSSLTCFCSASCVIEFPSLKEVSVTKCPQMKVFSQDIIRAPYLKKVHLSKDNKKWRWEKDLNTTIQQLHTQMVESSGIQHSN